MSKLVKHRGNDGVIENELGKGTLKIDTKVNTSADIPDVLKNDGHSR
jgi:hypothetical protein